MNETVTQRLLAMPEPCTGKPQGILKLRKILAAHVLEFAPFEQIPDAFLRIELGCIGRQTFQVKASRCSRSQKVFDRLAVVDGGPIPDEQQFPRDLAQELLEKAHHIWS